MEVFQQIHKNFGFGMMRLPMKDEEVDVEQTNKMVGITFSGVCNFRMCLKNSIFSVNLWSLTLQI